MQEINIFRYYNKYVVSKYLKYPETAGLVVPRWLPVDEVVGGLEAGIARLKLNHG